MKHISGTTVATLINLNILNIFYLSSKRFVVVVVVVITPPSPPDGGMAQTAIQVHVVNLIEIRLGERWQPISNQSSVTGSPATKSDCHWWVPKSRLLRYAGLATSQL